MEKKPLLRFLTHSNNISLFISIEYSVGRPKHEKVMITTNEQDVYLGDTIVINSLELNLIGKIQRSAEA